MLAACSIALDQSHASWLTRPRRALGHVVFVGLGGYFYVVLAAVQKGTPPTLGAVLAVVLTVVALLILPTLVYRTLNQMRGGSASSPRSARVADERLADPQGDQRSKVNSRACGSAGTAKPERFGVAIVWGLQARRAPTLFPTHGTAAGGVGAIRPPVRGDGALLLRGARAALVDDVRVAKPLLDQLAPLALVKESRRRVEQQLSELPAVPSVRRVAGMRSLSQFAPVAFGNVDVIVLRCLADVRERDVALGVGDVLNLVEACERRTHVPCICQRLLPLVLEGEHRVGQGVAFRSRL